MRAGVTNLRERMRELLRTKDYWGQFREPQEFFRKYIYHHYHIFTFVVITFPTILGLFEWAFSKMYPGVPLNHDLELAGNKGGGRGTGLIRRLAVK